MIIAKKSSFMIGIRVITLIIIAIYMLYDSTSLFFMVVKYIFIVYAIYQLTHLFINIFQPKELIKVEDQSIYINKIFKTITINFKQINDINYKQSKNNQNLGTIYITLKNNDNIKIMNVDKIEEATRNLITLVYNSKIKSY